MASAAALRAAEKVARRVESRIDEANDLVTVTISQHGQEEIADLIDAECNPSPAPSGDAGADLPCFVCGKMRGQPPERCPGHYAGTSSDPKADEFAEMARQLFARIGPACNSTYIETVAAALRYVSDKRTRECAEIAKAARLSETGPDFFSVSTQRKEMARGIEDEIRRRYPEAFRESQ